MLPANLVKYYEMIDWKVQLAYRLGDGVVAIREGGEDSGFSLFFDAGAEGRRKLDKATDLWVVDHGFEGVFSSDPLEWQEAAKKVVDGVYWLDNPRELDIPLSIIA